MCSSRSPPALDSGFRLSSSGETKRKHSSPLSSLQVNAPKTKKRKKKRAEDGDDELDSATTNNAAAEIERSKQKAIAPPSSAPVRTPKAKKKKKKKAQDRDEDLDTLSGINTAIGKMDSRLLADYVAQRTKRFAPELSFVRLQDLYVPDKAFLDTTAWNKSRTLENLPAFLECFTSNPKAKNHLSSSSKENGAPHTLVVAAAGLRAADICRCLRVFQTQESSVEKLFAKHIKLKDAISRAKKTRFGIGVGTPSRLSDLLEAGALSLTSLERIVIDASHIDQKKRGVLDILETQQALVAFLSQKEIRARYGDGDNPLQVLCY